MRNVTFPSLLALLLLLPSLQGTAATGSGIDSLSKTLPLAVQGVEGLRLETATNATVPNTLISGNIGIGIASPQAALDVNGESRIGNSGKACSSKNEGAQRYDSSTKQMLFCNGTKWTSYGGGFSSSKWYNFTEERALSTTYTNDTESAIQVGISVIGSGSMVILIVGGVQVGDSGGSGGPGANKYRNQLTAIIPPHTTYEARDVGTYPATLTSWAELR